MLGSLELHSKKTMQGMGLSGKGEGMKRVSFVQKNG